MPLFPEPVNVTGVSSLMEYMNLVTYDFFGLMILIPLWVIIFLTLFLGKNGFEPQDSFATASAGCLVLSILMSIINMAGFRTILIFMLLTGGSAVYIWLKKAEY